MSRLTMRRGAQVGGAALAVGLYYGVLWPRLTCWGATPEEYDEWFPGDELVEGPASCTTRALDVDASPRYVWPWLLQVGTDRGGWYSHDRLEQLVGVPVHSSDRVHEEWQHLEVGDLIQLAPPGWMGMERGLSLPVVRIEPERHLVLRQSPPDSPWDGVWSFNVRPTGRSGSRLIIHSRTSGPQGIGKVVAPLGGLVTAVMEIGMLRGVRSRAELLARQRWSGPPEPPVPAGTGPVGSGFPTRPAILAGADDG